MPFYKVWALNIANSLPGSRQINLNLRVFSSIGHLNKFLSNESTCLSFIFCQKIPLLHLVSSDIAARHLTEVSQEHLACRTFLQAVSELDWNLCQRIFNGGFNATAGCLFW